MMPEGVPCRFFLLGKLQGYWRMKIALPWHMPGQTLTKCSACGSLWGDRRGRTGRRSEIRALPRPRVEPDRKNWAPLSREGLSSSGCRAIIRRAGPFMMPQRIPFRRGRKHGIDASLPSSTSVRSVMPAETSPAVDPVPEANLPEVSVIVAHLNQPELLRGLLETLFAQDFDMGLAEVIVIDNGSRALPHASIAGFPGVRLAEEARSRPRAGAQPRHKPGAGAADRLHRRRLPGDARLAADDPRPLRCRPRARGARRRHPHADRGAGRPDARPRPTNASTPTGSATISSGRASR